MDVMIDYQRKDKDATKLPLLLLSSFAAKMPMQTSVCQTVGVRARMCHFSRFGERACWRKGHGGGGLRACAPAFAGELCCQCVNREEKTTWWWFACVHACVVAGEECVWARTRLKRASQTGITSNAEIMSNDHQHCRRTRAHTHAHMYTQLFSIPPHLLGPGGASQFQCQLCFVFAKHKSRHPEFFFYCILLWKKYYMEGKKTSCRTNAGWKQDVQTEGFVFVRFIASVLTALHPAVHFLFAADVISATLLVHWQQPYTLGVNWKLGS